MKISRAALALLAWPGIALADAPGVIQSAPQPVAASVAKADAALPRPLVAAPAGWVDVAPLPKAPSDSAGAATIQLLGDVQVRFAKRSEERRVGKECA